MKKAILISGMIILSLTVTTRCSATIVKDTLPAGRLSNAELSKQFLQKSKNQKIAAWVLLGAGVAFDIVAAAVYPKHYSGWGSSAEKASINPTIILFAAGTALMLGSIPFFASAKANKKRAMRFSFQNELIPRLQNSSVLYKPLPSLHLTIGL